jgi:prevent-host-death family protein
VERVPVRELNQDTAGVLARVERGEAVEITRNGRPVARITPIGPHPLSPLIVDGEVVLARHSLTPLRPRDAATPTADTVSVADLVAEDRDERR